MGIYMKAIELPVDLSVYEEQHTATVVAGGHAITIRRGYVIGLRTRRSFSWMVVDVLKEGLVIIDSEKSITKKVLWEDLWSKNSFIFRALKSGGLIIRQETRDAKHEDRIYGT